MEEGRRFDPEQAHLTFIGWVGFYLSWRVVVVARLRLLVLGQQQQQQRVAEGFHRVSLRSGELA
jgi:hypothetical protein